MTLKYMRRPMHACCREAGEVYTKKIGSVYRSVYCTYICILPCYTTLSSIDTSRFYTLLPLLYQRVDAASLFDAISIRPPPPTLLPHPSTRHLRAAVNSDYFQAARFMTKTIPPNRISLIRRCYQRAIQTLQLQSLFLRVPLQCTRYGLG